MKYSNSISLVGTVKELKFDHFNNDNDIYRLVISTDRLSGISDEVRVNVGWYLLHSKEVKVGDRIQVEGTIRTYRKDSHLIMVVVAKQIITENVSEQDRNVATVDGFICKPPIFRATPLGRYILDLHIAHNDDYGRSSYIPSIMWGQLAHKYKDITIGEGISVTGRLQSRKYIKLVDDQEVEKTANEYSIISIKPLCVNSK